MEKQYAPVTNEQELTDAISRSRVVEKKFAEYTR